jgi:hypothetical protein
MRLCKDGQCLDNDNMCHSYHTDHTESPNETFTTLRSALDASYSLSHSCVVDAGTKKVKHQTLSLCNKLSCLITDANHNPKSCRNMTDQSQVSFTTADTKNAQALTSLLASGYHNLPCSFCEMKPPATSAPTCTPAPTQCPSLTRAPTTAPTQCPSLTRAPTTAPTQCPSLTRAPTTAPTRAPTPIFTQVVATPYPSRRAVPELTCTSCAPDPKDATKPELLSPPLVTSIPMCTIAPTSAPTASCTVAPTSKPSDGRACSTFPPQPSPKVSCAI